MALGRNGKSASRRMTPAPAMFTPQLEAQSAATSKRPSCHCSSHTAPHTHSKYGGLKVRSLLLAVLIHPSLHRIPPASRPCSTYGPSGTLDFLHTCSLRHRPRERRRRLCRAQENVREERDTFSVYRSDTHAGQTGQRGSRTPAPKHRRRLKTIDHEKSRNISSMSRR